MAVYYGQIRFKRLQLGSNGPERRLSTTRSTVGALLSTPNPQMVELTTPNPQLVERATPNPLLVELTTPNRQLVKLTTPNPQLVELTTPNPLQRFWRWRERATGRQQDGAVMTPTAVS